MIPPGKCSPTHLTRPARKPAVTGNMLLMCRLAVLFVYKLWIDFAIVSSSFSVAILFLLKERCLGCLA